MASCTLKDLLFKFCLYLRHDLLECALNVGDVDLPEALQHLLHVLLKVRVDRLIIQSACLQVLLRLPLHLHAGHDVVIRYSDWF